MRRFLSVFISLTAWAVSQISTPATNPLLTSMHLHVTQKRIAVFTLWSGLSSAIIVMLRVFTWTLNWTEIVHMSRMIHSLAWTHNPLHLRWIIYVAVHNVERTWFVSSLWCFLWLSPTTCDLGLSHTTCNLDKTGQTWYVLYIKYYALDWWVHRDNIAWLGLNSIFSKMIDFQFQYNVCYKRELYGSTSNYKIKIKCHISHIHVGQMSFTLRTCPEFWHQMPHISTFCHIMNLTIMP